MSEETGRRRHKETDIENSARERDRGNREEKRYAEREQNEKEIDRERLDGEKETDSGTEIESFEPETFCFAYFVWTGFLRKVVSERILSKVQSTGSSSQW